jgi:pimeloyl-ACP methyl ester carboxylesterase
MKRLATVVGVGIMAVTAVLTGPSAQAEPRSGLDPFYRQTLTWRSCQLHPSDEEGRMLDEAGARCANVVVPLDYANPHGRTITVAISRIEASDRRNRIGVLLINGGGPGDPSSLYAPDVRRYLGSVGERFDVVGMDPRFVGRSTPIDCDWPAGPIRSAGSDRAGFTASVALARDFARRCGKVADVLPYVSTRNTARDMDVIRAALGERKLSYLGYSYGSYLGAVYLQLFGDRADRIVLDGPTDPDTFGPRLLRPTAQANEIALRDWARWVAQRHGTYGLGDTRERVLASVRGVFAAAERNPLSVGEHSVGGGLAPVIVFAGLADDRDEPRDHLARAIRVLADAARNGSAAPTPWLAEALGFLATGAWSQYGSSQTAILCGDVAAPRDVERYWRDIQRSRAEFPFFGPLVDNIGPCAFWPNQPREVPTKIHNDVRALIVAATGDPRTIYANAAALRTKLTNTKLITLRAANVHGVYGEYANLCVDTRVNAYLASGRLPATDLTCTK